MYRRALLRSAFGLVLGLAFLPWAAAQESASGDDLPSAESILERYAEAIGAAAYEDRTSEAVTGTMQIPAAGLEGDIEVLTREGLMRTTIELPGIGVIESGVKDGVAWETNGISGPRILQGAEADYAILNARPGGVFYRADAFSSLETTGIEDVNGEAAYRVVQTPPSGEPITNYFGVDSGLLLKTELTAATPMGNIPIEQFLEGYTDFEGVLAPSRLVIRQLGQQSVVTITSAEANVEIPDERFDLPEAVQALLE